MKLAHGRYTLWTDGDHPFAQQAAKPDRQLALELYSPKGGMVSWIYLITEPREATPTYPKPASDDREGRSLAARIFRKFPTDFVSSSKKTAEDMTELLNAGFRVPPSASEYLKIGIGGEMSDLWEKVTQNTAYRSIHLVGAAWEEVGVNLYELKRMASILCAAHAATPKTIEELDVLVKRTLELS